MTTVSDPLLPRLPGDSLPRLPGDDDREPPPTEDARNQATFLALAALLGVTAGLLLLVAMILPGLLYVLLAVLAIPLYFVFHYVVWGRLMSLRQEGEESER